MFIPRQAISAALIGAAASLWFTGVTIYNDVKVDCPKGPNHNGATCAADIVWLALDGILLLGSAAGAYIFLPEVAADAAVAASAAVAGEGVGLLASEAAAVHGEAAVDAGVELAQWAQANTVSPLASLEAPFASSVSAIEGAASLADTAAIRTAETLHPRRASSAAPALFLVDGRSAHPSHTYGLNRTRNNPALVEWQWTADHPIRKYTTFTHNNHLHWFHHRNITDGSVGFTNTTTHKRQTSTDPYGPGFVEVTLEMNIPVDTVGSLSQHDVLDIDIPSLTQGLLEYLSSKHAGGGCFQLVLPSTRPPFGDFHEIIFGLSLQAGNIDPTVGYPTGCENAYFNERIL